ncbi:hypothetical protein ANN_26289 [Periplaneta americana]|uniref:Uncharacterized protein n=1 Tax=Periplaneta americana TaxID=6978 RepID=A0ABQ8S6B0_PERAM|nr:hypothetical protein ANN_26289 [Periplaneta americana]
MEEMLLKWLSTAPCNIKELQMIVAGHSFIPPDRVFGNTESQLKRMAIIIINPKEYDTVFSTSGKVFNLGTDYPVLDWKTSVEHVIKPIERHYKFNVAKGISITRHHGNLLVGGEQFYKIDSIFSLAKSVFKKGKSISMMKSEVISAGSVAVKKEKLQDVNKLIRKHFGDDWLQNENLVLYKNVLQASKESKNHEQSEAEDFCEYHEESANLHIKKKSFIIAR